MMRLTMAQALVRFLGAQLSERDGRQQPFVGGVFGIFGHGNVAGIGQALHQSGGPLRYYQCRNEQAMVHTAAAFAKATNRLRQLLRAEALNRMIQNDPKTGILQLKVLDAGGSQRITRNLILGSKIRHSGGAIVSYLLFDKMGVVHSSEMFYYHTGFQKMDNNRGLRN